MAHIDAGKTTLTERIYTILVLTIKLVILDGNATMDWMEQEKKEVSQLLLLLQHAIGH